MDEWDRIWQGGGEEPLFFGRLGAKGQVEFSGLGGALNGVWGWDVCEVKRLFA